MIDNNKNLSIKSRIIGGLSWITFGSIFTKLLTLLSTIVLANLLGQENYGKFSALKSTMFFFVSFTGLYFGLATTKYVSQYIYTNKKKVANIISSNQFLCILINVIIILLILIFSKKIAINFLKSEEFSDLIKLGTIIIFTSSLYINQIGILNGIEFFKNSCFFELLNSAIFILLTVFGAYFFNLKGAVIGYCLQGILILVIVRIYVNNILLINGIKLKLFDSFHEISTILKFTIPGVSSSVAISFANWASIAMLINHQNNFGGIAAITISNQWQILVLFFPQMIGQILVPVLSSLSSANNKAKFYRIFLLFLILSIIFSVIGFTFLYFFSEKILWFYGKDYIKYKNVFMLTSFSATILSINNIITKALISKGLMKFNLLFDFCWSLIFLITCYLLIPNYNVVGVGYASCIAAFLQLSIQLTVLIYIFIIKNEFKLIFNES